MQVNYQHFINFLQKNTLFLHILFDYEIDAQFQNVFFSIGNV